MKKGWFNIDGEMNCADWTGLFHNGLKEKIEEYYQKKLNSFRVEWRRNPPIFIGHGEHNYIRVIGPNVDDYLVLDPWGSGGKRIIPKIEKNRKFPLIKNILYELDGKTYAFPKHNRF